MIQCDITARNFEPGDKVKNYVEDKIGGLEKYLPRNVRTSALAQVVLELDPNGHEANQYVCDVVLMLPGGKLKTHEATLNIYAAIDIVEAKLHHQLQSYKEKRTLEPRRAKMLTRWMGRVSETDPNTPAVDAEL